MKVLHIAITLNPRFGGPQEVIRQSALAFQPIGVDTAAVVPDSPDASWFNHYSHLEVICAPRSRFEVAAYRKTIEIAAQQVDFVLIHNIWTRACLLAWTVLRNKATPYYIYPHGMLDPAFKKLYPVKHLRKALYWKLIQARIMREATGVIFTCDREYELARQNFKPFSVKPIVAPCPVGQPEQSIESLRTHFYSKFPDLNGKRLLLYLGRIHPKKGPDLLLEAFARTLATQPGSHLVIAGPGEPAYVRSLKKQAQGLGISEKVFWPGMLEGTDKWAALAAAEAFALTSHQENFGIAVAEALACGTPVLISDQVNIAQDIARDGAALIDTDTLDGATRLLGKWQGLADESRQTMSRQARQCFVQRYQREVATRHLLTALGHEVGN